MPDLAIQVERNPESLRFIAETEERFKVKDIARNPFMGKIALLKSDSKFNYYGIRMEPLYPRLYVIGLILLLGPAFFIKRLWSWAYLPGLLMTSTIILWSPWFYYFVLTRGLAKIGFKGEKHILLNGHLLKILLDCL